MGGATQAHAGLYKNDAAIKKTEAANQWNYYQARAASKTCGARGGARARGPQDLLPGRGQALQDREDEIKVAADKLEAQAKAFDEMSEQQMHQHHRWAQATTALQISIAMAAISLLTKKRWTEYVVYAVSALEARSAPPRGCIFDA